MAKVAAEVGSTANKYEILAKLATGGMADIFLARGESVAEVERYCVLKRILRERAGDAQLVQMFLDEARLAAQLQHPNIASVYDVGKLGDSYFFTMEYVHGETVRSLLHRASQSHRAVPLGCALAVIAGVAAGLHHAHERNGNDGRALGIVHRDVSPSNVMISYEGNVKVVDFGVAKASHRAVETKSGTVKGKISYLSPEQCRGERVDRRSDLFSLGIVMWELLTGRRLYRRDSDFANMTAIVQDVPAAPSRHRPDLPPEVDAIVLRLLAKSVDDRFQTADDVVDEIETVAVGAGLKLSASAVGRFVRELCGRRPEPWLELAPRPAAIEPITLTNASVSTGELDAVNLLEAQLANLAELSLASGVSTLVPATPSKPAAVSLVPTMPLGVLRGGVRVELAPVPADPVPVIDTPVIAAAAPPAKPIAHPSPAERGARLRSSPPYLPSAPRSTPEPEAAPAAPAVARELDATATDDGEHVAVPVAPRRRGGRAIVLLGTAVAVGVTAAWLIGSSGDAPVPGPQKVVVADEPVRDATSAQAPAELADAPATPTEDSPPVVEAPATQPDVPAEPVAAPPRAVAALPHRPAPRASRPAAALGVAAPVASVAGDALRELYRSEKYVDVIRTCASEITADLAPLCARAACKEAQPERAYSWIKLIRAQDTRNATRDACQRDLDNRTANIAPPAPEAAKSRDAAEIASCDAGTMTQARASACTQAACRAGAAAKALRWVAFVPAAQRATLAPTCEPRNIDLDAQTNDCTADPAACP